VLVSGADVLAMGLSVPEVDSSVLFAITDVDVKDSLLLVRCGMVDSTLDFLVVPVVSVPVVRLFCVVWLVYNLGLVCVVGLFGIEWVGLATGGGAEVPPDEVQHFGF